MGAQQRLSTGSAPTARQQHGKHAGTVTCKVTLTVTIALRAVGVPTRGGDAHVAAVVHPGVGHVNVRHGVGVGGGADAHATRPHVVHVAP